MRSLVLTLAVMMAASSQAQSQAQVQAEDLLIPQPLPAEAYDGPAMLLARAEQVIQLARKTRAIIIEAHPDQPWPSDLRVSLVVLHNGPSTDVSPTHDVHLALFNLLPEYGTAWALEPIASVYKFEDVTRQAGGVYEITALRYSLQDEGCQGFVRSRITVDARDLAVAVRNAQGLAEFDAKRYTVPVNRTVDNLGCVE